MESVSSILLHALSLAGNAPQRMGSSCHVCQGKLGVFRGQGIWGWVDNIACSEHLDPWYPVRHCSILDYIYCFGGEFGGVLNRVRSSGFGKLALQEVKSAEDHSVIVWCNLTTCGVLPATKYDFFLTAITNLLAAHKRNGLAVIFHCNRASDGGRTGETHFEVAAGSCCLVRKVNCLDLVKFWSNTLTCHVWSKNSCHESWRKATKLEKAEKEEDDIKSEQTNDEDADGDAQDQDEDPEEADIRDMRFKLETLWLFFIFLFEHLNHYLLVAPGTPFWSDRGVIWDWKAMLGKPWRPRTATSVWRISHGSLTRLGYNSCHKACSVFRSPSLCVQIVHLCWLQILRLHFQNPNRQNVQKQIYIWAWSPPKASIYGKRSACSHGLAVVHRDKGNIFKRSVGWKHGAIRDVTMLSRAGMFKPEVPGVFDLHVSICIILAWVWFWGLVLLFVSDFSFACHFVPIGEWK